MAVIQFAGAESELNSVSQDQLRRIAALVGGSGRRVQLNAYADGTAETISAARRLSLARALTVRSYLIEQGIRSSNIDVRALGIAGDTGPADRVDILLEPV